jgi:hypothetical protein
VLWFPLNDAVSSGFHRGDGLGRPVVDVDIEKMKDLLGFGVQWDRNVYSWPKTKNMGRLQGG